MSKDYVPNPKLHLYVSIAKSVLRIVGYGALIGGAFAKSGLIAAGILLAVAELLGIVEELV
jgi:hypothetical protein